MSLELAVSRAATLASNLVAALHSDQPWYIEVAGLRVPAERVLGSDSVAFIADFPPVCFLDPPDRVLLWEGETLRAVKPYVHTGRIESVIWEFEVDAERITA